MIINKFPRVLGDIPKYLAGENLSYPWVVWGKSTQLFNTWRTITDDESADNLMIILKFPWVLGGIFQNVGLPRKIWGRNSKFQSLLCLMWGRK